MSGVQLAPNVDDFEKPVEVYPKLFGTQMAAALIRNAACLSAEVHSAGTKPGSTINTLPAEAIAAVELVEAWSAPLKPGRPANPQRRHRGVERMRLVRAAIAARVKAWPPS